MNANIESGKKRGKVMKEKTIVHSTRLMQEHRNTVYEYVMKICVGGFFFLFLFFFYSKLKTQGYYSL